MAHIGPSLFSCVKVLELQPEYSPLRNQNSLVRELKRAHMHGAARFLRLIRSSRKHVDARAAAC